MSNKLKIGMQLSWYVRLGEFLLTQKLLCGGLL